jgi:hypothetical protein
VLDDSVVALRWQTGFFGADSLGLFATTMARLRQIDGILRILVGSNDGTTQRSDIETLIRMAGPPRVNQRIGIVSFDAGFFHPKTVHVLRGDKSAAAYVGSANLTTSGVASLHVEAGLLLDTRERDDPDIIAQIAGAVDWWFGGKRRALSVVRKLSDLRPLVKCRILDVPRTPPPARLRVHGSAVTTASTRLSPLLRLPKVPTGTGAPSLPASAIPQQPDRWSKQLTRSDAQRKAAGNQRGSITLVQAGYQINAQAYFRNEFFKTAIWKHDLTSTREDRETAIVPFQVDFLGRDLGVLKIMVTHAPNREASQSNYTSLLHLGPLAPHFAEQNVKDKWLFLDRHADGNFNLSIRETAT